MDRRLALLIVGALVAMGGVGSVVAQVATPVASPVADAGSLRFDVEFNDTFVLRDPNAGPQLGDQIILNDRLLRDGELVGHSGGVCTVVDLAGELLCVVTFALPEGTISAQLLNTPPPVKAFAITGGTGGYAGARGTGVLTEAGDETGTVEFLIAD